MLVGFTTLFTAAALITATGTLFSIVFPAPARTVGFITRLWALPGLVMAPVAGAVGDAHGMRWGSLSIPTLLIGSLIVGTGGRTFQADMAAAKASMAAIRPAIDTDSTST